MNLRGWNDTWQEEQCNASERIERVFNEKNLEGLNGVVEKINNERISLLWTYG